jgi:hypothetical protein
MDPQALLPFCYVITFGGLAYLFWWSGAIPKTRFNVRPIHAIMWVVIMVTTHPWTYRTDVNPAMTTIVIGAIAAYGLVTLVK